MPDTRTHTTLLLRAVTEGDPEALNRLFQVVYEELRRIAHAQRRRWHGNKTLNTTAIVHEAYLKLVQADRVEARDRSHFFSLASKAMRQILTNYAREQSAEKRGGGAAPLPLDGPFQLGALDATSAEQLIELDEALSDLERLNERAARVVECRFFAGLTVTETAHALGTSPATVKRDWAHASAWLRDRLDDSGAPTSPRTGESGEADNL